MKKNNLFLCIKKYLIRFIYCFSIVLIIASGNNRENIITTNINQVKNVRSSNIFKTNVTEFYTVYNTADIKKYGDTNKIMFNGTITGYGPDCTGCSGVVACYPNPNVKDNIYYEDKDYGKIRILAADYSIPCGSIIKISNYKFINNDFYGIVLDRGSAIVGLTMDLLHESEEVTVPIGRQYNINFKIVRWGYYD